MNIVSIDIGGTAIKYALLSEAADILYEGKIPTPYELSEFKKSIVKIVKDYEKSYEIEAVGISMPGFINSNTGFAERGGALTFLDQTNIIDLFSDELSFPIFIENDANCVALAESGYGNAVGVSDFLVLTVGTGIGGALYLNDELYTGGQFQAGELGKMRINYSTHPHATLHEFAAMPPLIRNYKALDFEDTPEMVTGEYIFEHAKKNEKVQQLITDWVDTLCVGIFNMAVTLNPQKILIGGGVSENPDYIALINERMHKILEWDDFEVPITACKFHNRAGIMGAYHLAKEKLSTRD